jgi:hypothetical protein
MMAVSTDKYMSIYNFKNQGKSNPFTKIELEYKIEFKGPIKAIDILDSCLLMGSVEEIKCIDGLSRTKISQINAKSKLTFNFVRWANTTKILYQS